MSKPLIAITGASSGIGMAVAKVFSLAGYPLLLMARRIKLMEELLLPNSLCCQVDVTDYEAVSDAINKGEARFGFVDGLINNAGYAIGGEFIKIELEKHHHTIQVNIQGIINGMYAVLPSMRRQSHGTIINISSLADRSVRPNLSVYAASKAAVKSLTESLRAANASYGIRICNLAPAKIQTPMMMTSGLQDNQTIPVENLAEIILWMYEQPQKICIRDMVFAPTYYED